MQVCFLVSGPVIEIIFQFVSNYETFNIFYFKIAPTQCADLMPVYSPLGNKCIHLFHCLVSLMGNWLIVGDRSSVLNSSAVSVPSSVETVNDVCIL